MHTQIETARDRLYQLIINYGISSKQVLEASKKLDELIIKLYKKNKVLETADAKE